MNRGKLLNMLIDRLAAFELATSAKIPRRPGKAVKKAAPKKLAKKNAGRRKSKR
jgi:hypothetical protein